MSLSKQDFCFVEVGHVITTGSGIVIRGGLDNLCVGEVIKFKRVAAKPNVGIVAKIEKIGLCSITVLLGNNGGSIRQNDPVECPHGTLIISVEIKCIRLVSQHSV